jgi:outer membrane protein assembly factor BamD
MSQITDFPMLLRSLIMVCAVALGAGTGACGSSRGTGKVNYSVSATQNYEKGMKKLEQEDWIAAAKYFSFIKARFPYSKFAVLAELRLSDAEYGAGNYLQAIDSFKLFLKFHPTHEMVVNGYASFKIGQSYYKMLPGDWWILPPSFEKDQSATADAHRELSTFLKKYPDSPYVPTAQKMLGKINLRLAEHEMYVARFYWERDRPAGTVLRLKRLLDKHGGVGLDADALYLLGRAYMKVKMPDRARKAWERLLREFPNHEHADDARDALKELS